MLGAMQCWSGIEVNPWYQYSTPIMVLEDPLVGSKFVIPVKYLYLVCMSS